MSSRTCVLSCQLLAEELARCLSRIGADSVTLRCFPAACHLSRTQSAPIEEAVRSAAQDVDWVLGICMNCHEAPFECGQGNASHVAGAANPRFRLLRASTQAALFLGEEAASRAVEEGAFLILPGWLARWRTILIDHWGFTRQTAREFFSESTRKLLLVDTGVRTDSFVELQAMSEFVGLPCERQFTGTSPLERLLAAELALAESESLVAEREALAADHAMVSDFVTSLGSFVDSSAIVERLESMSLTLFGARSVYFVPAGGESTAPDAGASAKASMLSGGETEDGFEVAVAREGQPRLGTLRVEGLPLPRHREQYRSLARTMAAAAAVALDAAEFHRKERRVREELERSNRDLEQFAFVASHDLQEPLRTVASFAELLEGRYGNRLDPLGKRYLAYAVDATRRMRHLIQDLLAYARVATSGRPLEEQAAGDALAAALANLASAVSETRACVTQDPLPAVQADAVQLVQLFQNLLGNALKFSRPGELPRIHVSSQRASDAPGRWTLTVADNGIGIDPKHFDRLFQMFHKLHARDKFPGSGIGLALCKRIVERHGGRIWLESQPGTGTTFFFTLPAVAGADGSQLPGN